MTSDLKRIADLHATDERASKQGDYATLRSLMSDDAAILPPGGQVVRGREALDRTFAQWSSGSASTEVVEYRFDWREVQICGAYAFEWGYIQGRERHKQTGRVRSQRYHVMRVLQKQADGAWKVHRSIWNDAPPS